MKKLKFFDCGGGGGGGIENCKSNLKLFYQKIKQHKKQIFYFFLIFLLLFADDFIFRLFKNYKSTFITGATQQKIFIITICLTSFIIFSKKIVAYITIFLLGFLSFIQLSNIAYFGSVIHPITFFSFFEELPDIMQSGFGEFGRVYYAFLSAIIPYSLITLIIKKVSFKNLKYSYLFLLCLILPLRTSIKYSGINKSLAVLGYPSIYNGINLSFSVVKLKVLSFEKSEYKDYIVKQENPANINIILNMGESFTSTNLHILGYDKQTTPFLDSIKKDKNFIYKKGFSNAVGTRTALINFFNLQREPYNFKVNMEQKSNLFRMAKANGFKVIVISVQDRENFNLVQNNAIDILITIEDIKKTAKHDDGYLLELLKEKVNLNEGKNFVVLHQRSAHTPYNVACPDFGFENFYDNCIYYNDSIYKETLSYLKTTQIPFYYFITSDHGEMLGQNGLYGHNFLNLGVTKIPMFLYTNDKNRSVFNEFKNTYNPTNYEVGILIAKLLGWTIENPNTPDNIYYVSSQYRIKGDYIKIEKEGNKIKTSTFTHH